MHKVLKESPSSVRQALLSTGIRTAAALMSCDADEIARKTSIAREEVAAAQRAVRMQYSSFPVSGSDLLDDIMSTFSILPTGCDNWDELLDGGLYSGEVTEIVGAAGSGKTQACMSIAASVPLNLEKNVLYIDTAGSFSSQRLKEILYGRDSSLTEQDIVSILSRVHCVQAFDVFAMLESLESTREKIYKEEDSFYQDLRLIIVDCVAAVITPILGGRQITGHAMMVHLSRNLKSLALHNALAVLVTNNVVSVSSMSSFAVKPALGETWSHIPNTRVFIQKRWASNSTGTRKDATGERIATVTKSSRQPLQISTTFYIGSGGILNVKAS